MWEERGVATSALFTEKSRLDGLTPKCKRLTRVKHPADSGSLLYLKSKNNFWNFFVLIIGLCCKDIQQIEKESPSEVFGNYEPVLPAWTSGKKIDHVVVTLAVTSRDKISDCENFLFCV